MREELPLFTKIYDFAKWVIPTVERFPKSQRFQTASIISNLSLELYERMIEAQYTKKRLSILDRMNLLVEKLRLFLRLTKDLGYLPFQKFESGTKMLYEIGKMIGGWRRSSA